MKEGLFWVTSKNSHEFKKGDFELITHFERDAHHPEIWMQLASSRKEFGRFEYDYFPRGRIWVDGGTAIVFINPVLETLKVIERLRKVFELEENYMVCSDGFVQGQKL